MKQPLTFDFKRGESFPHLPLAPVVEAVIHWVARAGRTLERDELREQLAQRLPEYPQCHAQQELEFEARLGADGSTTQIRHDTWRGFRFTSADKLQIVQFGRDGIVFSRLAPYESWDVFSAEGKMFQRGKQ